MGRHTEPASNQQAGGRPQATSEQIRMARLTQDSREDQDQLTENVHKLIDLTSCTTEAAQVALHDCDNDVNQAVSLLLDGKGGGEWIEQKGKKGRRAASQQDLDTDDAEPEPVQFSNAERSTGRRRGTGGFETRGGAVRNGTDTQPPRMRNRFNNRHIDRNSRRDNKENESLESDVRLSHDGTRGRGRGRDTSDRGRGNRGRGGGRGRGAFGAPGMGTWSGGPPTQAQPKDSNTWDNSMARGVVSKDGTAAPAGQDNMWDNSMAAHLGARNRKQQAAAAEENLVDDWNEAEEDWTKKTLVYTNTHKSPTPEPVAALSGGSPGVNNAACDSANLTGHFRGENIDVTQLLTSASDRTAVSAATDNATAWLKQELRIGSAPAVSAPSSASHMMPDGRPSKIVEFSDGLGSAGSMDIQFGFNLSDSATPSAAPQTVEFSALTADSVFSTAPQPQRTPSKTETLLHQNGASVLSSQKDSPGASTTPLSSSYPSSGAPALPPLSLSQSQPQPKVGGGVFAQSYDNPHVSEMGKSVEMSQPSLMAQAPLAATSMGLTLGQGKSAGGMGTKPTQQQQQQHAHNQLGYSPHTYYTGLAGTFPYMNAYPSLIGGRVGVDEQNTQQALLQLMQQYPAQLMSMDMLNQVMPVPPVTLPQQRTDNTNFAPAGSASGDLKSLVGAPRGDSSSTSALGPPPGFSQPPSVSNAAVAQAVMGQVPQFGYQAMLPPGYLMMPPVSNGQTGMGATQMHNKSMTQQQFYPTGITGYEDNMILAGGTDYSKPAYSQSSNVSGHQQISNSTVKAMMSGNAYDAQKQYATAPNAQLSKAFEKSNFATGTPPPALGSFGIQPTAFQAAAPQLGYAAPAPSYHHPVGMPTTVQLSPMALQSGTMHLNEQRGGGQAKGGYNTKPYPSNFGGWSN